MTDFDKQSNDIDAQKGAAAYSALSAAYDSLTATNTGLTAALVTANSAIADLRSPSGKAMPTDVPSGWKQVFADDFDTPCAEGQFLTVYGPRNMGAYQDGWPDTSKHGKYSTQLISAANSVLSIRLLGPTATNPFATVASVYPKAGGPLTAFIFEERTRYTFTPGFKAAHLAWPDKPGSKYPDGEMDWPEFTGTGTLTGFVHIKGGKVNNDQKVGKTTASPTVYNTTRIEWEAGKYVRYLLNGQIILNVTDPAIVPSAPFHFSLQNETALSGTPTAADHGLVETDWMRVLVRA